MIVSAILPVLGPRDDIGSVVIFIGDSIVLFIQTGYTDNITNMTNEITDFFLFVLSDIDPVPFAW